MKWVPWVIVLPYIANMSGWILTEMGRQPWIVQGLLKVQDAVSPNLTPVDLLISLIGFALLYGHIGRGGCISDEEIRRCRDPDAAMQESMDLVPAAHRGAGLTRRIRCLTNFFKYSGLF